MAQIYDFSADRANSIRSQVIGAAVRITARKAVRISYSELLTEVIDEVGLPEEEVGRDLILSVDLLVRIGLLRTNTFDQINNGLEVNADTQVALCADLQNLMESP